MPDNPRKTVVRSVWIESAAPHAPGYKTPHHAYPLRRARNFRGSSTASITFEELIEARSASKRQRGRRLLANVMPVLTLLLVRRWFASPRRGAGV